MIETKDRIFGCDVPYLDWLRHHPEIRSRVDGICVTDADVIIHQYKSGLLDAQARRDGHTRKVQALMGVEIKTRSGLPDFAQTDTLWKWSLSVKRRMFHNGSLIHNFGWSFVRLSGTRPDDSDTIHWGRFNRVGQIDWTLITEPILVELMGFRCHPDNFDKRIYRRHHKTQNIWRVETTPLGLTVPVLEVRRS